MLMVGKSTALGAGAKLLLFMSFGKGLKVCPELSEGNMTKLAAIDHDEWSREVLSQDELFSSLIRICRRK